MKHFIKFILASVLFYIPFAAQAWGILGHRIVGEIAASYLTATAKKRVQEILGYESMAIASNWADFIKSDSTYDYLYGWHFINLKDGLTYNDLQNYLNKDTAADAYTKLNFLVKELKNKQLAKDKQLLYLRLVIHIVGDIHQPMHVGRLEDRGGNNIKLLWFNESSNLHSIWDDGLINFQKLSYTEYSAAINHTEATQRAAWQKQPISQWIYDSYTVCQQLYKEIKAPEEKMGYLYNFNHIQTLNDQLLKGGVHLAGLLNEIFGK